MSPFAEIEAFDLYKREPTPGRLSDLLGLHQGFAFNLCFQVLDRREDAEDAAQEALIRVVEGIPGIDTARAFRYRLYRICLTHALNRRRGNSRRLIHESRYAMKAEPTASTPEAVGKEGRAALLGALDLLEDDQRGLIVEHYFEQTPLEAIAAREGVTKGAIWQRIDRARRSLKETIARAGLAALVPDPTPLLEACRPVSLTADLVPGVMAKVAALQAVALEAGRRGVLKWILASARKPLAWGGLLMSVKSSISLTVAAVILAGIVLLGGIMVRVTGIWSSNAATRPANQGPGPEETRAAAEVPGNETKGASQAGKVPTPKSDTSAVADDTLKARLAQFRAKLEEKFPDRVLMKARQLKGDPEASAYVEKLRRWMKKELAGLKELILSEPADFLAFFQSAQEGDFSEYLLEYALLPKWPTPRPDFSTLPLAIREGLGGLLRSGTPEHKCAILHLLTRVENPSADIEAARPSLIADSNTQVQESVLSYINNHVSQLTDAEAAAMRRLAQYTGHPDLAGSAAWTLAQKRAPGFEETLLEVIGSTGSSEVAKMSIIKLAESRVIFDVPPKDPVFEQRFVDVTSQAIRNHPSLCDTAIRYLLWSVARSAALPAIDQAAALTSNADLSARLKNVAEAIRLGTTDLATLWELLPKKQGFP